MASLTCRVLLRYSANKNIQNDDGWQIGFALTLSTGLLIIETYQNFSVALDLQPIDCGANFYFDLEFSSSCLEKGLLPGSISSSVAYAWPSTRWSPNELVPMVPPGPCAGTHAREVPAWCQGYHLRPICPLSLIRQCELVALLCGDLTKSHIPWPKISSTWRSLGFFLQYSVYKWKSCHLLQNLPR